MVTEVVIGLDRIMLTAYNPRSLVTRLKCQWVLRRIVEQFGRVPEEEFLEWLGHSPEGAELVAKLRTGWRPPTDESLTVDPLNAAEEAKIVAHLAAERMRR